MRKSKNIVASSQKTETAYSMPSPSCVCVGRHRFSCFKRTTYIRTRLTHSLEVNQLAKSIASALGKNMDLVEAIALGHNVGHTPFGHIGERNIAEFLKNDGVTLDAERGFKHNLQALRLLCDLEKGADYP